MSEPPRKLSNEDLEQLKSQWAREQEEIAAQLIFEDNFDWSLDELEEKLNTEVSTPPPRGGKRTYRPPTKSDLSSAAIQVDSEALQQMHDCVAHECETAGSTVRPTSNQTETSEAKTAPEPTHDSIHKRPLKYVAGVDISFFGCNSALAAQRTGLVQLSEHEVFGQPSASNDQDSSTTASNMSSSSPSSSDTSMEPSLGGTPISGPSNSAGEIEMACASLVIQRVPDFETVYQDYIFVPLTVPYVTGFLAFREVPVLLTLFNRLKHHAASADPSSEDAQLYPPDVVFTDGNGSLHPRGCGVACHLGIATGLPTVGVAKKIANVDGITRTSVEPLRQQLLAKLDAERKESTNPSHVTKPWAPLIGNSGRKWGAIVFTSKHASSTTPVFVSPGHRISLETSVKLAQLCSLHRVVEPIRAADLGSRDLIRQFLEAHDTKQL